MHPFLQHFEFSILIPLLAGIFILVFHNHAQLRESSSLLGAIALFIFILQFIGSEQSDTTHTLFSIAPGLSLAFHIEPLGLMFALLASGLWIVTTIYSIGYMRGN